MDSLPHTLPMLWLILVIVLISQRWRGPKSIPVASKKFWTIVKSQANPVVIVTTRGFFGRRFCYAFPYNGVIFRTDAREPDAPDGVTLVGIGNFFEL
jgi:hypothetical protein